MEDVLLTQCKDVQATDVLIIVKTRRVDICYRVLEASEDLDQ